MGARNGVGGMDGGVVLLLLGLAAVRGARAQAQPFQPPTPPTPMSVPMPMPIPMPMLMPTPMAVGPALILTADNCTQTVTLAPPLYQAQEFRVVQAPGLRCVLTFVAAPPEPWRPLQWPSNAFPAYGDRRRRARSAVPGPVPAHAHALTYSQHGRRGEPDASSKARSFSPWGGGGQLFAPTASFSYGPPALASGPAPGAYGPPQPPRRPPTASHHYDHYPSPEFVQVVSPPKWQDAPEPAPSPAPAPGPPPEAWLWWWWWQREAAAAEPPPPPPSPPPAAVRSRLLVQLRDVDVSPGVFDCELGGARVYSVLQGLPTLLLTVCGADNSSTASLSEDGVAIVTYTSGEVATGSGLTVSVQTIPQAFASYSPPPTPWPSAWWQRTSSWRSRRQGDPARPPWAASGRLVAPPPPTYPVLPRPQADTPAKDTRSEQHPYDQVDFYPGGYYYSGGCNNTRWDGRVKPPRK